MGWSERTLYHVTSSAAAADIITEGFQGGWGDAGFGVYFYGGLTSAEAYAAKGGWDGGLDPADATIIAITVPVEEVNYVEVNPAWPNPQDYKDVLWHEMDEDDYDAFWQPVMKIVKGPAPSPDEVQDPAP